MRIVHEELPANLLPLVAADLDSLEYEREELERRIAIKWRWKALGSPGPEKWDTPPGPKQKRGTCAEIAFSLGVTNVANVTQAIKQTLQNCGTM